MIFIYFTITALAASVLISLSLYQRMSRQVTEVVQEESQNLIAQVGRSVESYLRTISEAVRLALLWHDQECRSVEPVAWK